MILFRKILVFYLKSISQNFLLYFVVFRLSFNFIVVAHNSTTTIAFLVAAIKSSFKYRVNLN